MLNSTKKNIRNHILFMACLLFLFSLIRIENRIEAQSRPALEKFLVPYDGG